MPRGFDGRVKLAALTAAPVLVALAGLVGAPATHAFKTPKPFKLYEYKIQSEGSGTYTHDDGPVKVHASFKWNVTIKMIELEPKSFSQPPSSPGGLRGAGTGIGKKTSDGITGDWTVSVTGTPPCNGSGGFAPGGPPEANAYINPLVKGGYVVDVLPSDTATPIDEKPAGANDCADIGGPNGKDFWHDWPANEGAGDNTPALEEVVRLTPSKEGKAVQNVEVDNSEKPRSNCMCTFDWHGKVTMTRTKVISAP
jgi:hypothetical protein